MTVVTDDQELFVKWQEKIKRGFLWITILKLYDEKIPLSGTDLKSKINSMHHNWDPSPGSIYPILKDLEKDHLIEKEEEHSKNKAYIITKRGSNLLTSIRNDVFAFRMNPIEFIKRVDQNEEEFKLKFSEMYSECSVEELNTTKKHFNRMISWLDDLIDSK